MRIERLSATGFKSFGDRVNVEFSPGITCVVGPNGSGKSNILDALRWATGGGRAQSFRAEEKTDLIFHGAAGKKRMGRAEVEVELRHGEKRIKIRRSLDRDGETKLTLNGRNARFLDVEEELAGSGLGRGNLAVIGQGEVSGVLMADPSRLLSYVAEAAGVSRLATRREQTEARLDTARGHLDRLEEKLLEDAERIEELRAEADAATRHDTLRRRSLQLRFTVAVARADNLEADVATLRSEVTRLETVLREGRATVTTLREQVNEARTADATAEAQHREATAEHARAAAELRIAEHALEVAKVRTRDLEVDRERSETERSLLLAQPTPETPEDDLAALEAAALQAEAAWTKAKTHREEAERVAEAARVERERIEGEAVRVARAAADAVARRDSLAQQRKDVLARLAEVPDIVDGGEDAGAVHAEAVAEKRVAEVEARIETLRSELESTQATLADAAAEARAWERAAERQRAAFETRRGYAEGPRRALQSGIDGVLGSVADAIAVEDRYADAIALALGRRAEYVIVRDADVAREVVQFVRRESGWVTTLPLDLVRGDPFDVPQALLAATGVVGVASDLVSIDPQFEGVAVNLLSGTVIVASGEVATRLARRFAKRPRLVSLEGDVIEPGGALSGGRRQGRSPLVGAAADLEEAEAAATRAHEVEVQARAVVKAQQEAFQEAAGAAVEARDALRDARALAATWREARAARRHLRQDLEAQLVRLDAAERDLPEVPVVIPDADVDTARAADAEAREALQAARTAEAPAAEHAADTARALATAAERRRSFEAAFARHQEDQGRAQTLLRDIERLADAVKAGWASVAAAERRVTAAREAIPDHLDATREVREDAREALRTAEEALETAASRQAEAGEMLETARVNLARRETSLENAQEERKGFPEGLDVLEGVGERAARAELRAAEAELDAMGAVNHLAAQALETLASEHDERDRETREAREAVTQLATTLDRLDRETTSRLTAAIAGVKTRFEAHILELFGPEGRGEVEAELEEGRPVGLRIRLQPPGKQTQSLGLLSVGERTMGALAFLFALMGEEQGTAGLPIAVLDEVDAPLDEANIRRYRAFLERLAGQGTQFILITHQKATFEVADVIWGVTTEQGVSRVFSIQKGRDEPRSYQDALIEPEAANA